MMSFPWYVLVREPNQPHPKFWSTSTTRASAVETAEKFIKGCAPGAEAVVLKADCLITGTITVKTEAAS